MQSNSWSVFVSQKPNCFSLKSFCVSEHWNISTVSDHLDKWDDVWFSFSRCDCLLTSSRFARRPWSSVNAQQVNRTAESAARLSSTGLFGPCSQHTAPWLDTKPKHTQRDRETLQRPVSSASNCSSSSSSGVLNMSWSNRFTAERESWWTEGPVQTVHTQEPEPESPLKSFTKLKHGLFKLSCPHFYIS